MRVSGVVGLVTFWALVGAVVVFGGAPLIFVDVPSAIVVLGVVIGIGLMAFGLTDLLRGLSALRVLAMHVPDGALHNRHVTVLRGLISSSYAAAAIGSLIGVTNVLAHLETLPEIGPGIAMALLTTLYAVLLAEGVLRPAVRKVEYQLSFGVSASSGNANR